MSALGPLGSSNSYTTPIDYKDLLHLLVSQRWVILAFTAALSLFGLYKSLAAISLYQVNALVQVEDSRGNNMGLDQLSSLFQARASVGTEIELIRSRMVIGHAVDELGLDIGVTPKRFPVLGALLARRHVGEPSPGRSWFGSQYAWGGERYQITRFNATGALEGQWVVVRAGEPGQYQVVLPDGRLLNGGRVGLPSEWRLADGTIALFVRELVANPGTEFSVGKFDRTQAIAMVASGLATSERSRNTGMIDLRYEDTDPNRALRVLNQIASSYVRQNVDRKSAEAQKTLEFLDGQLPAIKQQLDDAEMRFNEFRARNNTLDVTKEGELLLQQAVTSETQLQQLQQRRREMLMRFTAEHPTIKTIDSQIASLQNARSTFMNQVDRMPRIQQEFLRLTRDLKVNQELYGRLLDNAQQLRVARAGTIGNARVIDYAVPVRAPYKPNRKNIFILHALAGLFLGLVAGYIRQAIRNGVKDATAIEQQLGLSVLSTVPESPRQGELARSARAGSGRLCVLAEHDSADLAIESLRSLRTSLQFASIDASNNVLMLTGPSPGIGKSFLAVNVAAVLAQAGERVLILDADLRRGHLHEYFGGERAGGISELIAGNIPQSEAVRASGMDNLDYLSTGTIPPNPSELLLHPRFQELLNWASAHYDRVVIDSPPILAVTDAAIIGRQAGTTLVVARFGTTPMRELELASRRLQQAGVNINGVVLNRVARATGYSYGYKYQYAYEYRSKKD